MQFGTASSGRSAAGNTWFAKVWICILFAFVGATMAASAATAQEYPGREWAKVEKPSDAGWDAAELAKLHDYIVKSTHITGFVVVYRGRIVFQYGDTAENSYIASCRKSVLAMLYGKYVNSGKIRLNKTLAEMGMDDVGGLLPVEKTATIADVLSVRSGVFHPASNPGDYLEYAPARGSVKPGAYWLYSNWDFNAAGYIFAHETGRNIYDDVQIQLAVPLQLQDWRRDLQSEDENPAVSRYGAYAMWFSTRDMARLGLLMLNRGKWRGKQVVDPSWIDTMLRSRTSCAEVNAHIPAYRNAPFCLGYGYMWWLWEKAPDQRLKGGFSALGSLGQSITVFPAIDTVIAYKTKDAYERETPFEARYRVLMMAAGAFKGKDEAMS